MTDDLRRPLQRRSWQERLRQKIPTPMQAVSVLCALSLAAFAAWAVTAEDPAATEPVFTAAIDQGDPLVTGSVSSAEPDDKTPEWSVDGENGSNGIVIELQNQQAALPRSGDVALAPAPQRDVLERAKVGGLPKISKSGRKPSKAYARPVSKAVLRSKKPKIALIIGGMGINSNLTRIAISDLPGEITFAFAPYGSRLQNSINSARSSGHEVLLHLPLEPHGYPSIDPGPKTLLVKSDDQKNVQDLHWLMSRFTGYTGAINYLGSRFSSDSRALLPVMEEFKKRGLIYVDDGSSGKSQAPRLGRLLEFPVAQGDVIIDKKKDLDAILAALDRLEGIAKEKDVAIGVGTGLSTTINAVKQWSGGIRNRDILLVPVSAAFASRRS